MTGGFSCQSFSIVAQNPKRLGVKDDRGMLFFEMCRILREKQPKCFIAENVKGLLSANNGEAFPLIIDEFRKSGYQVTYKLINAAHYGVPQRRERVIIVGIRNDLGFEFQFPKTVCNCEDEYACLGRIVEEAVPEKYYFSEKAVAGMRNAKKDMNKGRAQDYKPCQPSARILQSILNSTDPVTFTDGMYNVSPRKVAQFHHPLILDLSGRTHSIGLRQCIPCKSGYREPSIQQVRKALNLQKKKPVTDNSHICFAENIETPKGLCNTDFGVFLSPI